MAKTVEDLIQLHPLATHDPNKEFPPEIWLVDNLWLGGGKINGLFGPEKAGKSRFLCWALVNMIAGYPPLAGMNVDNPPQHVLYMRGEESEKQIVERIDHYGAMQGLSTMGWPITYMSAANFHMEWSGYTDPLLEIITRLGIDLVIMEPLRRLHGGAEGDNDEMSKIHNLWREWTDNHGINILFTHHTGKLSDGADMTRIATWSRGASDLAAILDSATFLHRHGQSMEGLGHVRLLRAGRFAPLPERMISDVTDHPLDGGIAPFRWATGEELEYDIE
jgi:RecA-family ATPase